MLYVMVYCVACSRITDVVSYMNYSQCMVFEYLVYPLNITLAWSLRPSYIATAIVAVVPPLVPVFLQRQQYTIAPVDGVSE